jgi:hypothetical protein
MDDAGVGKPATEARDNLAKIIHDAAARTPLG